MRLSIIALLGSSTTYGFVHQCLSRSVSATHRSAFKPTWKSPNNSHAALHMFQKFFGGGAYDLKIDYKVLDFPGPELATAAIRNGTTALVQSGEKPHLSVASFAGGCFWGLELAYQRMEGVAYTTAGYTGGRESYPTYQTVSNTGHAEAVSVYYDPTICSYKCLLETFFARVDPTTVNGQGRDFGRHYRTAVYYHTEEQEKVARDRFASEQACYRKPIATELQRAAAFWPAEKYHQQYLEKGGRFGIAQDASKNATDEIRCYG